MYAAAVGEEAAVKTLLSEMVELLTVRVRHLRSKICRRRDFVGAVSDIARDDGVTHRDRAMIVVYAAAEAEGVVKLREMVELLTVNRACLVLYTTTAQGTITGDGGIAHRERAMLLRYAVAASSDEPKTAAVGHREVAQGELRGGVYRRTLAPDRCRLS